MKIRDILGTSGDCSKSGDISGLVDILRIEKAGEGEIVQSEACSGIWVSVYSVITSPHFLSFFKNHL